MASFRALHPLPIPASTTAKPLMQQIGNPLPVGQDSSQTVAAATVFSTAHRSIIRHKKKEKKENQSSNTEQHTRVIIKVFILLCRYVLWRMHSYVWETEVLLNKNLIQCFAACRKNKILPVNTHTHISQAEFVWWCSFISVWPNADNMTFKSQRYQRRNSKKR